MKQPKPIKAYAIIKISAPKIRINDIFDTKEISMEKGEKLIKVIITPEE